MKDKYSFLSKNVLLFSISGVLPKILAFIIVPIYTSKINSFEYGIYELIHTTVDLLLPIFAIRIHDAVLRFGLDKEKDPKTIFSIGMKINFIGTLIVGIISLLVSRTHIFDNVYILAFFVLYCVVSVSVIVTRFCRAIDKTAVITISSVVNSVSMYSFTLLFLLVFDWGLNGFIFANILGYFSSICVCFFGAKLYKYITVSTSSKVRNEMIVFSFPLIFSALAWWINNASDKYILGWICGVSVSGIYAIAYKIPSLLAMIQDVFMQAWSISAIKDFDGNDRDGFISNIYTLLYFCMTCVASFLMLLNIPIANMLYSGDFLVAWKFVPPLLVALLFNAMSLFYDGLFMAINKTKGIALLTSVGAVVNTIANFLLIPFFGGYGASIATLIGFVVAYLLRIIYAKKYISIKKTKLRNCIVMIILLAQMLVSWIGEKAYCYHIIAFMIIIVLYLKEGIYLLKYVTKMFNKAN